MTTTILEASELDVSWEEVKHALEAGDNVVLDRNGAPAIVLIHAGKFEALIERLEDLEDAIEAIEVGAAIDRGEIETIPWEKVKAELQAEADFDE